jgi:large subunit ribosomal protein L3
MCTAVKVGPCVITRLKSADGPDGYDAAVLAYEPIAERKLTKPELGLFKSLEMTPHRHLREFRLSKESLEGLEAGQTIGLENLKVGNFLDIRAKSKGKGFSGVMKRHNFRGSHAGHGTHESFRGPGTGGAGSATPGRVPKGKKRPGRQGGKYVTIQSVQIIDIFEEESIILLKGGVPGAKGALVELREAKKLSDLVVAKRLEAAKNASGETGFVNPLKAAKRAARGG